MLYTQTMLYFLWFYDVSNVIVQPHIVAWHELGNQKRSCSIDSSSLLQFSENSWSRETHNLCLVTSQHTFPLQTCLQTKCTRELKPGIIAVSSKSRFWKLGIVCVSRRALTRRTPFYQSFLIVCIALQSSHTHSNYSVWYTSSPM